MKSQKQLTRLALRQHETAYNAAMRAMKDRDHREEALRLSGEADMELGDAEIERKLEDAERDPNMTNFKLLADAHAEVIRQLRKQL